jgi:hypothetical protein
MEAWGPSGSCYASVTYDGLPGGLWYDDNWAKATRIDVLPGVGLSGKDFRLPKGGSITGEVTQQDGTPIVGASVIVWRPDGSWAGSATSAPPEGRYSVDCLQVGEYVLRACPPSDQAYQCETYKELPGDLWCDGNLSKATRVPVVEGGVTPDINFTLDPPRVTLHLTAPNPGDCLTPGSVCTMRWTVDPPDAEDLVVLTISKGNEWGGIIGVAKAGDGVFSWTVSRFLRDGNNYSIGIGPADYCGGARGDERGPFCYAGGNPPMPTITVFSPGPGQTWYRGTEQCVEWAVQATESQLPLLQDVSAVVVGVRSTASSVELIRLGSTSMLSGKFCHRVDCNLPDGSSLTIVVGAENDFTMMGQSWINVARLPADYDGDCDVDLVDFLQF